MDVLAKFSLKGRVAVVTGGCGHLGKSMTESLQEAGAKVIVWGSSEHKFKSIFGDASNIVFAQVDIAKTKSIKDAFNAVQKKYDRFGYSC